MIQPERLQILNALAVRDGRFVLYWMQASQRADGNHALEFAVRKANRLNQPVVVGFGLTDEYPDANERHYAFMLEGLAETGRRLAERGIQLVVRRGSPPEVAAELAEAGASLVVTDRGYLRHQRLWREELAARVRRRCYQVESDAVVPVEAASSKGEYAARTLRPKLHRQWARYLTALKAVPARRDSLGLRFDSLDIARTDEILLTLDVDRTVGRTSHYVGGVCQARRRLRAFIGAKLRGYADRRNDPSLDIQSHMSPYLHFGQISPLEIALAVRRSRVGDRASKDAYLEELLVRRELAINYVFYNRGYDAYASLPRWARATLKAHRRDRREHVYTLRQLEAAETHDPYWNAAMTEMRLTGKMHNYMRMYWGKKILEWTRTPATAFRRTLELNNRYFLDGRDPASYANVAWCFGRHDRPWKQRPIFGTVRYMNAAGLQRKFDMAAYVRWVAGLHAIPE